MSDPYVLEALDKQLEELSEKLKFLAIWIDNLYDEMVDLALDTAQKIEGLNDN